MLTQDIIDKFISRLIALTNENTVRWACISDGTAYERYETSLGIQKVQASRLKSMREEVGTTYRVWLCGHEDRVVWHDSTSESLPALYDAIAASIQRSRYQESDVAEAIVSYIAHEEMPVLRRQIEEVGRADAPKP